MGRGHSRWTCWGHSRLDWFEAKIIKNMKEKHQSANMWVIPESQNPKIPNPKLGLDPIGLGLDWFRVRLIGLVLDWFRALHVMP
jgi:hypothetical protein